MNAAAAVLNRRWIGVYRRGLDPAHIGQMAARGGVVVELAVVETRRGRLFLAFPARGAKSSHRRPSPRQDG